MKFHVIIPARYASTRFPGKPLADIAGKPMVVHVCERARRSGATAVHVATDDPRIAQAVRASVLDRIGHVSSSSVVAADPVRKPRITRSGDRFNASHGVVLRATLWNA